MSILSTESRRLVNISLPSEGLLREVGRRTCPPKREREIWTSNLTNVLNCTPYGLKNVRRYDWTLRQLLTP